MAKSEAAPTDAYELLHWNMKLAHLTYELGYKNIIPLLDNPPLDDLKNFLGYCEAWGDSIVHHHDTEEATVFPVLNQKMDFSHEQEQHVQVHQFLDEFLATVRAAQADHSKFDPKALKALMEGASTVMFDHFNEELTHIEPDKFRAAGFTEAECRTLVDGMVAHAKTQGDPFLVVPFMRCHTPPEWKVAFPPGLAWPLRKVVIPYLLAKRYSGYWKYGTYPVS